MEITRIGPVLILVLLQPVFKINDARNILNKSSFLYQKAVENIWYLV